MSSHLSHDREIKIITKSLMPSASTPQVSFEMSRILNSPEERRKFLLKSIQERLKQQQGPSKLRKSLFAPIDHGQILLNPSKSSMMAIGVSQRRLPSPAAIKGPKPKFTLEQLVKQRQMIAN